MKKKSFYFFQIAFVSLMGTWLAVAEAAPAEPLIDVKIHDLTPKFLTFYDDATREQAAPDQRWMLWKRDYDFAAVPPTPAGQTMARKMLDDAWPRYPAALDRIRTGAAGMTPDPRTTAQAIAGLLKPVDPIKIAVVVYVGAFENNAFTAAQDGMIMVAVPIEAAAEQRKLRMTHEMTHAIQIGMGSFSGGWIRTVGTTVLTEGLAMRVTQKLNPDVPSTEFTEGRPGWLAEADSKRIAILKDVQGVLSSKGADDVMRYTIGKGQAGIEREAYYAGWLVVGYWLEHGMSFADIARIPESDMPDRVGEAIQKLLAESSSSRSALSPGAKE
jgi:hypothetical protein